MKKNEMAWHWKQCNRNNEVWGIDKECRGQREVEEIPESGQPLFMKRHKEEENHFKS